MAAEPGNKRQPSKAVAAASTQASIDQESSSAGPDPLQHHNLNAAAGRRKQIGRAGALSRSGQVLAGSNAGAQQRMG
jgi:hypothetical protein